MNRGVAKGMRLRGCWTQWLATALLLLALAAVALQATAHSLPAGHMIHAEPAIATSLDQHCDHSQEAAGCFRLISGDQDGSGEGEPGPQDDCRNQFCTITALLPDALPTDPPAGGDFLVRFWSDRLGRTPEGLLRPPRSSTTA